ncbi:MAG: sigma-70 family RNA polymerase sigma factor [Planctomycetota bacterium]
MNAPLAIADDAELLRRHRRGDGAALGQLIEQRVGVVYAAACRRVGCRDTAADVTQAAWLVLIRRDRAALGAAERDGTLVPWLLAVVRNVAANAAKRDRHRRHHEQEGGMRQADAVASADPTDVIHWQDLAGRLDDALLSLGRADRTALTLRYFENRPVADIAHCLRLKPNAARQRLHRALGRLRDVLERRGVALSTTTLGSLLTAHVATAAPTTVIAQAATIAAAGSTAHTVASTSAVALSKGTFAMLNAKLLVVSAAGIAGVAAFTGTVIATQDPVPAVAAVEPLPAEPNTDRYSVMNNPAVVVATVPRAGDTAVDPTLDEIRVTFSKPMVSDSYSFAQVSDDSFPETTGKPRYIAQDQTFVLPVKLEPNTSYVLRLNYPPFNAFTDETKIKAEPYLLIFETAGE